MTSDAPAGGAEIVRRKLSATRSALWTIVVLCCFLVVLALPSQTSQRYASADHWLGELSQIDLGKWAGQLYNRQNLILDSGFGVGPWTILSEESERAQLAIRAGTALRIKIALGVEPSASETSEASMQELLTRTFCNVEMPQLFYLDKEALSKKLRRLFSEELGDAMRGFALSSAVIELDNGQGKPGRASLRLEWQPENVDPADAARRAVSREILLDGEYKDEAQDFTSWVREQNSGLFALSNADESQPWAQRVREELSPVWSEIEGKTLAAASGHVRTRLSEARRHVVFFGLVLDRSHLLLLAWTALLCLQCARLVALKRIHALPREAGIPASLLWRWPLPNWLARLLMVLSVGTLPVGTFLIFLGHLDDVVPSTSVRAAVLVAGAGAVCAALAVWSTLALEHPQLSASDKQRIKLIRERVARYRRSTWRLSYLVGVLLVTAGLVGGLLGVLTFALRVFGAALGPEQSVRLPLLAIVLSPLAIVVGWLLAAGKKQLVLFLRRFQNEALNDSVRDLVRAVLRRRARLVTLDDSKFTPLGPRWRALVPSLLPSGIVLGAMALGFSAFAKVAESELRDETPFGGVLILIEWGIELLGLVAGLVALLLLVTALRAHVVSHREIHDASTRRRVVRRLSRLRSFFRSPAITAPMATVVTVTDAEWQAAVAAIARVCDVALVDISEPRENIRWELATLQNSGISVVLLAQRDALSQWWDLRSDDLAGQLAAQLRLLAADLPLVTYDAPDQLEETELLDILSEPHDRRRAPQSYGHPGRT